MNQVPANPKDPTALGEHPTAAGASKSDGFAAFWAAFPRRDGDNHEERARAAYGAAVAGARAYGERAAGWERRYVMGAARWLSERRWRDERASLAATLRPARLNPWAENAPGARGPKTEIPGTRPLVWVKYGSAEWDAWAVFYKATKGKTPPQDVRGGWRFPSPMPPALQAAE